MSMTIRVLFVCAAIFVAPAAAQDAPEAVLIDEEFPGAFLIDPSPNEREPVIVVLGGSEGNDSGSRALAPLFAEAGYAVAGYPYYSPAYGGQPQQIPGLPRAFHDIPVERLGAFLERLQSIDGIDASNLGLYGVSKGAEFVLLAGQYLTGFDAIAAIVPTDVVWEGWGAGTTSGESSGFSYEGEPLAFVPYVGMNEEIAKFGNPDETPYLRGPQDIGRDQNLDRVADARVRVEDIEVPLFMAGGDKDRIWASGEMAQAIAERRLEAGLPTETLLFTDAGHALSGDGSPRSYELPEADLEAQKVVWPATLAFFERHLRGGAAEADTAAQAN